MEFSIESCAYLGLNAVLGGLSLYHTPTRDRWIAAFALGVLAGGMKSSVDLQNALDGYVPGNSYGLGWDSFEDNRVRERGVSSLVNSVPGFFTTLINAVALAVVTKSSNVLEPYGSRYEPYMTGTSAFLLGYKLGHLFNLDRLRRNRDPEVAKFTDRVVI